jgi:hypothetical protein
VKYTKIAKSAADMPKGYIDKPLAAPMPNMRRRPTAGPPSQNKREGSNFFNMDFLDCEQRAR